MVEKANPDLVDKLISGEVKLRDAVREVRRAQIRACNERER